MGELVVYLIRSAVTNAPAWPKRKTSASGLQILLVLTHRYLWLRVLDSNIAHLCGGGYICSIFCPTMLHCSALIIGKRCKKYCPITHTLYAVYIRTISRRHNRQS